MAGLDGVSWPPEPIRTERLVLRPVQARDRAAYVDLLASAEVFTYLGGARPRHELERDLPQVPGQRSGVFAVELAGAVIGSVTLGRRDPDRPGRVLPEGGEVEVSYLFLPSTWGRGYASEAVGAALDWLARELVGEPVVLCTQSANTASVRLAGRLGFTEVDRFDEFGAEQWFGVRPGRPRSAEARDRSR